MTWPRSAPTTRARRRTTQTGRACRRRRGAGEVPARAPFAQAFHASDAPSKPKWPASDECKLEIQKILADRNDIQESHLKDTNRATPANRDVSVTILNGTRRNIGIIFVNVPALYNGALDPVRAYPLGSDFARSQGKYLSQGNPNGWFLVYVRFRDPVTNDVRDTCHGLHDLFASTEPYINISRTTDEARPFSIQVLRQIPKEKTK
jgi:hypothetical protein